jgi:hypothetical protein
MTKPRSKPKARYQAFIVEPAPGFKPTNWRQTPTHYRIVEAAGARPFKGNADAWKFLHNHDALADQTTNRWAIYLDLEMPVLESLAVALASR